MEGKPNTLVLFAMWLCVAGGAEEHGRGAGRLHVRHTITCPPMHRPGWSAPVLRDTPWLICVCLCRHGLHDVERDLRVLRDEMSGADDAIAAQSRSLQITIEGTRITTRNRSLNLIPFLPLFCDTKLLVSRHQLDAPVLLSGCWSPRPSERGASQGRVAATGDGGRRAAAAPGRSTQDQRGQDTATVRAAMPAHASDSSSNTWDSVTLLPPPCRC